MYKKRDIWKPSGGTISLVLSSMEVDVKTYCSKEDRDRIISEWQAHEVHKKYFHLCYIHITPSLDMITSRELGIKYPQLKQPERYSKYRACRSEAL